MAGAGGQRNGDIVFQFCKIKCILGVRAGDGRTKRGRCLIPMNCHFKIVKTANFMFCIFSCN